MLTWTQASRAAGKTTHDLIFRGAAGRAALAGVLAAVLAGCTLSDSLIPPNPIPEARPSDVSIYAQNTTAINPSTGEDRMATAAPASGPVQAGPLPPPAAAPAQPRSAPSDRAANSTGRAASFPASARADSTKAAKATPRPVSESQPQSVGAPATAHRKPAQRTSATVRFTPVIGAPASAISPLSEQLEKSARRHGVVIRNTADKPVDNILRGYFSASTHGSHTELVYMWDVLDNSGTLLHRIQGTLRMPGGSGKPWHSVPDAAMKDIARKTISAYLAWRTGQAG